ncbi:TIGR02996 domain-containing protein [Gemmata sp. JC673]|uniref:TIGR02996 domain-containing protein n=1 Tax=Gemmata algarum TaxID=2975278 RepID=A0ABU5ERV0_9BACT|nr:TIGR02996 domain-containing protein [Gemmata algarum]MDY3558063.1 TIGR02996 domain-containing protein [Gemmata algarum]
MPRPPLSDEDKQFLRAILAEPAELTAWLAYADWLDEHEERDRSEFLRLEVRFVARSTSQTERHRIATRLETLRPTLDPNWVAIFDRPPIENCDKVFEFPCPKKWEQLQGTDDPNVRHCGSCGEDVYYSQSLTEARTHAQMGRCVAVATGVDRFPGDLDHVRPPERVFVGMIRRHVPEPGSQPDEPKRPWWKFW